MNFLTLFTIFGIGLFLGAIFTALCITVGETSLTPPVKPISFADLPAKDPDLDNTQQGLYKKFFVNRTDGSDGPGGKHENCDYFVLDLTHDPYALETAAYYARACKATYPLLYQDLMKRVNASFQTLEDQGKL